MLRDEDVNRGRSRRIRRPVGLSSMRFRSWVMKNGCAVVSPKVAIRSVAWRVNTHIRGSDEGWKYLLAVDQ